MIYSLTEITNMNNDTRTQYKSNALKLCRQCSKYILVAELEQHNYTSHMTLSEKVAYSRETDRRIAALQAKYADYSE